MSNQSVSIYAEALKRQQQEAEQLRSDNSTSKPTSNLTPTTTLSRKVSRAESRAPSRDMTRETPRNVPRETRRTRSLSAPRSISRDHPTRDEIQEFSFRLRDELRVKVQAEVPPHWQGELEEIARELNVRKLELYRFIIGEFLGKVKRKGDT